MQIGVDAADSNCYKQNIEKHKCKEHKMTDKLFTVAGTSLKDGKVKFRFSNDIETRIPMLQRTGHTDIKLVELPEPMNKQDAIAFVEAWTGEWVTGKVKQEDEPAAQGPALAVTEDAIAAALAAMTANGRPRNAKGHFVKLEELRDLAIAQLAG
jgi:hypothetical protein